LGLEASPLGSTSTTRLATTHLARWLARSAQKAQHDPVRSIYGPTTTTRQPNIINSAAWSAPATKRPDGPDFRSPHAGANPKSLIHINRRTAVQHSADRSTQTQSAVRSAWPQPALPLSRSAVGQNPNPKPPAASRFPRHLPTSPAAPPTSLATSPAAHFASRQPTTAAPTRQAPVLHAHAATRRGNAHAPPGHWPTAVPHACGVPASGHRSPPDRQGAKRQPPKSPLMETHEEVLGSLPPRQASSAQQRERVRRSLVSPATLRPVPAPASFPAATPPSTNSPSNGTVSFPVALRPVSD
jgi:hypothetical protein